MSEIFNTGSTGEQLLAAHLTAHGHVVSRSDKKMFDLIVDGRYAEVKTSRHPYSKLGFIGLSTGTTFRGNILALTSITLNDNVAMTGRALARNGAVSLGTGDTITLP